MKGNPPAGHPPLPPVPATPTVTSSAFLPSMIDKVVTITYSPRVTGRGLVPVSTTGRLAWFSVTDGEVTYCLTGYLGAPRLRKDEPVTITIH